MTPLAKAIVEQRLLPVARRTIKDDAGLLSAMEDVHCFQCTVALELANQIVETSEQREGFFEATGFLPFPKTWIEYEQKTSGGLFRFGILLRENADVAQSAIVSVAIQRVGQNEITTHGEHPFPLQGRYDRSCIAFLNHQKDIMRNRFPTNPDADLWPQTCKMLIAMLAIINSPRIVHQRTHLANSSLQRKMVNALGVQGKWPLHAWTEIKLLMRPPKDFSGEAPRETYLTGKRLRHAVRKHLRICSNGKLIWVSAHWRGDASLGIKQQRYALKDTGKPSDRAGLVATLEAIAEMPR